MSKYVSFTMKYFRKHNDCEEDRGETKDFDQ